MDRGVSTMKYILVINTLISTIFAIFVIVLGWLIWRAQRWPSAIERFHFLKNQGKEIDAYIFAVKTLMVISPYPKSKEQLKQIKWLLDRHCQLLNELSYSATVFGKEFIILFNEAKAALQKLQKIIDKCLEQNKEFFDDFAKLDWNTTAFKFITTTKLMLEYLKAYKRTAK
jgi:uncharacterized membrane protein YccC